MDVNGRKNKRSLDQLVNCMVVPISCKLKIVEMALNRIRMKLFSRLVKEETIVREVGNAEYVTIELRQVLMLSAVI
jgi:hypothetical protein